MNELFPTTDSPLSVDGYIKPVIEDPFKLSQGIGISSNHPSTSPVGLTSPKIVISDISLSATSFVEQPLTVVGDANSLKPNSTDILTTSFDPLTGAIANHPIVGFLSKDETQASLTRADFKATQSDISQQTSTINVSGKTNTHQRFDQLTPEILEIFRTEAIARWASVGITPGEQGILKEVQLAIADLPSLRLGLTQGNVITLDQDAAGIGWFIDLTPDDDSEFNPIENSPVETKIDLLSALVHEMGHVLGISHVDYGTSVMDATLPPGVRRFPTWEDIHSTHEISSESTESNFDTLDTNVSSSNIVYWVGGSGFWDDLTHWSTGRLPGATDEVVIDVPQEVMITFRQGSTSIAKLTTQEDLVLTGGDLTILGEGAINNDFILNSGRLNTTGVVTLKGQNNQWLAGTLSGPGIVNIAAEATLNINNGYYKYLRNQITLNNQGTVNWNSDYYYIDGDHDSANEVINNQGIFEIKNDVALYNLTFNNSGSLIKSNSTGTTTFSDSTFNNTGTVDLRQGRLYFSSGKFIKAAGTIHQNGGTFDTSNSTFIEDNQLPDFKITGVDVKTSLKPGSNIGVSWTVENQGKDLTDATTWYDAIYLSIDNTFDVTDTFISRISKQTVLAVNTAYTVDYTITLPQTATGNQYLLFITDEKYYQLEGNENNNVFAQAIQFLDLYNNPPTDIQLSNKKIDENSLTGTLIGTLSTTDPDLDETHTYKLLDSASGRFFLDGNQLKVANGELLDFENQKNYNIIVQSVDKGGLSLEKTFEISINNVNEAPFDIQLSNTQIDENSSNSSVIGILNTFDLDGFDTHIYSLVNDAGGRFKIIGNELQVANGSLLNFEDDSSHTVTIRATDADSLSFEKTFTIAIKNVNEVPTVIQLSNNTINENSSNGTVIATFTTTDTDNNDSHTYTLLNNADGRFAILNNQLIVANSVLLDYEQNTNHIITVRTQDIGGLTHEQNFNINVINLKEVDLIPTITKLNEIPTASETILRATSGDIISLEWDVTNAGADATLGTWVDRVYLSDAPSETFTPNSNDFIKEVTHTGGLLAKTSYSEDLNIKLPINISGTKYLYVITDANNSVNEINNTEDAEQNIVFQQLQIELAPYADLAVSHVTAPTLTIGDPASVTIDWTVTNLGNGIGKTSTWVDRIIASLDSTIGNSDDIILANFTHDGFLNVGENYTRSEKLRLSPGFQGQYQLFVQTDATAEVFENNLETNNTNIANNSFSVVRTPYADLLVSEVQAQATASSGQQMQVSWKVANSGIGITNTSSWTDRVKLASDPEGKNIIADLGSFEHVGALAVGGTYNPSVDVTLPNGLSGNYYLVVTTGGPFEFIYTDNNSRTSNAVQVNFTPPPDLVVTNVTSPTAAQSGNKIDVSWTVANSGVGDAVGSWTDQIFLKQVGSGEQLIFLGSFTYGNGLLAGKNYTRSEQFVLPSTLQGLYEVVVKTNATNSLYENSATDNNTTSTNPNNLLVNLTARPDLQVKEIIAPTTVNAGGTISLDFIISNEGTVGTNTPNWQDRVYLSLDDKVNYDDLSLGSFSNGAALASLESYRTQANTLVIPKYFRGEAYLIVQADASGLVDEYPRESNNTKAVKLNINSLPPADLVTSQVVAPTQAFEGSKIKVSYTVTNLGIGETDRDTWTDTIWLTRDKNRPSPTNKERKSEDILLTSVGHNGVLKVGEKYSAQIDVTLPSQITGEWYISAWSDAYNVVLEDTLDINTNPDDPTELDNNNYKARPISILLTPPPDLVVTTVVPTTQAVGGQPFSVSWTVQNQGANGIAASNWVDNVYLSDSPTLNTPGAKHWFLGSVDHGGNLGVNESLAVWYLKAITRVITPKPVFNPWC
ncbi:CARDB domain-containing protein (plasmid) [Nostoc sp. UHCC 0926]|uniref:CARDB domain-containing protein n=1 Tax=Nostoc sp. UHCC 0926 TaxID=3025190 RepID=UPI00235FE145|nr:CARDB domain-containing protein [Nostoc sp. UHCC 0926]WDD36491.1 CARDB domain-containing protein [Nostoc sp. UHCC 0926]